MGWREKDVPDWHVFTFSYLGAAMQKKINASSIIQYYH
jgi:hypothetical protein